MYRLAVFNCNRLWSVSGRVHDGFHGFSRFLCQHDCHSALLQEPVCPHDTILPKDQTCLMALPVLVVETLDACTARNLDCRVTPAVRHQTDIQWRLLSEGERPPVLHSLEMLCARVFGKRLLASIDCVVRALPGVPLLVAGDSNVWFPGLVDSRPPRNADRGCLELIRLLLDRFNLEIHNHVEVPTHRHGAALDGIRFGGFRDTRYSAQCRSSQWHELPIANV